MRALVISGGGSKGAFAGGVAQHLLQDKSLHYDMFLGTSTGSLLIPHLALGKVDKIKNIYTTVDQDKIFNVNPFIIKKKDNIDVVAINHINVLKQFLKGKRTFGESENLRNYIKSNFKKEEFDQLKSSNTEVIVTVTNFSLNCVEYKSIRDFDYEEFCDWIWISCNYIPFMSLATKNDFEYGDGGFSNLVPIREAINRGAKIVDVIVLETQIQVVRRLTGGNPFSLLLDLFQTLLDQVEKHNITIGKLAAKNKDVNLNFYYTPTQLTNNALIFNKEKMNEWWEKGYQYSKNKSELMNKSALP